MNKGRRDRQRRKENSSLRELPSVDGSDSATSSAVEMRRRIDAIIRATRKQDLKLAEEGKFAFLKRGKFSPNSGAFTAIDTTNAQGKSSNLRAREAAAVQGAESLDICAQVEETLSDFIRRASIGDRLMATKLIYFAVHIISSLN